MNSNLPLRSWTSLNPNAREFVPTTLKPITSNAGSGDETENLGTSDNGKAPSEKVESSDSCASDEESRRYWNAQLPDDILSLDTDFYAQGGETSESISSQLNAAAYDMSDFMGISNDPNPDGQPWERTMLSGRRHLHNPLHIPEYGNPHSDRSTASSARQIWDNEQALSSHQVPIGWNEQLFNHGNSDSTQMASLRESRHGSKNALGLLTNEFPNVPSQNLLDIYKANGDVSGMLTQLKLQEDGSSWQSMPSASNFVSNQRLSNISAPRPNFSSGSSPNYVEENAQNPTEFVRLMRKNKMPWTHERSGAGPESHLRSSNLPPLSSYSDLFGGDFVTSEQERMNLTNIQQNFQVSPQNLMETDDVLVNVLTELRDEARDHACIRNAYFEQARQAYFVGDKILAREASAKGQLHNRLMKVAQSKAAELVFQQRNISSAQGPSIGPGQTQLLDLRGLHVNEAVTLLKRELSGLRSMARSLRQRQQVFISVGTGHAKGSRTPSRLLTAVKRHLVENELLSITEPQPGIVRVVVS